MTTKLGSDVLRTQMLLAVREIKVETEGPTAYGPVIEAVAKFRGFLLPVRRSRFLALGEYMLVNASSERDVVGMVTWDTDEILPIETHLWACPVLVRAAKGEGKEEVGDCLVLKVSAVNLRGEMTFERVGKGVVADCWTKGVLQEFTVV